MNRVGVERQPRNWENIYNIHARKGVDIHNTANFIYFLIFKKRPHA